MQHDPGHSAPRVGYFRRAWLCSALRINRVDLLPDPAKPISHCGLSHLMSRAVPGSWRHPCCLKLQNQAYSNGLRRSRTKDQMMVGKNGGASRVLEVNRSLVAVSPPCSSPGGMDSHRYRSVIECRETRSRIFSNSFVWTPWTRWLHPEPPLLSDHGDQGRRQCRGRDGIKGRFREPLRASARQCSSEQNPRGAQTFHSKVSSSSSSVFPFSLFLTLRSCVCVCLPFVSYPPNPFR